MLPYSLISAWVTVYDCNVTLHWTLFGFIVEHYMPGIGISSRTSILLPSIMECGWSESMACTASISSAWSIVYPPMNVVGLELPAFVTFISLPVGVAISTSACLCASNHVTQGS